MAEITLKVQVPPTSEAEVQSWRQQNEHTVIRRGVQEKHQTTSSNEKRRNKNKNKNDDW